MQRVTIVLEDNPNETESLFLSVKFEPEITSQSTSPALALAGEILAMLANRTSEKSE
jgi:hypothetical protein